MVAALAPAPAGRGALASHMKLLHKVNIEQSACFALTEIMVFTTVTAAALLSHFRFEELFAKDHAVTFDVEENANFAFSGIVPYQNGRMGHKGDCR